MGDVPQHTGLRVVEVLGDFGSIDPTVLRWADGFKVVDHTKRMVTFHAPPHYVDLEWLGVGAQGAVVKAVDTRTGVQVAIKMLCCREQPTRVLREIRAMGRWVRHSNLTCAEELYQTRDEQGALWVYIVMPLMTGSFEHWLRDFRKHRTDPSHTIPPDTVAMIGYQALRGLLYLHSGGVHHRDLGARNILYQPLTANEPILKSEPVTKRRMSRHVMAFLDSPSPDSARSAFAVCPSLKRLAAQNQWNLTAEDAFSADNEAFVAFMRDVRDFFAYERQSQRCVVDATVPTRLRIAISDFGLSRVGRDADDTPDGRSALTDYVVTRYYRAPELILGHGLGQYSGEKVDIWSLGCVLGELVCPKLAPFLTGRTSKQQIEYIFLLLGVPDPEEVEPFATPNAVNYVRGLKQNELRIGRKVGTDFSNFFTSATPDCVDALRAMLVLSPSKRSSASELLDMPFFVRGAELCGAVGEPIATSVYDQGACDEVPLSPTPSDALQTAQQQYRMEQRVMAEVEGHCLRADRMRRFAVRSVASQTVIGLLLHACVRHDLSAGLVDHCLQFIPD